MSDYAQSVADVEKAIESNSITEMNELMVSLGDTTRCRMNSVMNYSSASVRR